MSIKKIMKPELSLSAFVIKPIISCGVMGVGAFFGYQWVSGLLGAKQISTAFSFLPQEVPFTPVVGAERIKIIMALGAAILVAVVIYAVMVFVLKLVKREDVLMLPKGEKLARLLDRFKLLS